IHSLRQDCPTLASVSGTWSLLDGRSAIAMGSFCRNRAPSIPLTRAFSPVSHAPALLLDPLLPGPLQRRGLVYARAARAAGRAGDGLPGAHDRHTRPRAGNVTRRGARHTLELPVQRFQVELGAGRAAQVMDLSVNGVRVTLMPTVSSRAERSP